MRTLLLLASLSLAPAARAGVDFKCDSVKYDDQVSGWLRFGSSGKDGSVQLERWTGYPPEVLVDASLDAGKAAEGGLTRFVSGADASSGTVAFLETGAGFLTADKFRVKAELISSRDGKTRELRYELNCVRH